MKKWSQNAFSKWFGKSEKTNVKVQFIRKYKNVIKYFNKRKKTETKNYVKHAKIQENVEKTEKIKNRIENTIILKIREVKNESDFRKAGKQIASR